MEIFLGTCHDARMDIVEQGQELPGGELCNCFAIKVDEIRLKHYSPWPTENLTNSKHQRAWPHTDFGMLTLLSQDEAGGLEVENHASPGSFIPIRQNSPTEMSVYVSDTLKNMADKYLQADIHQIVTQIGSDDRASGSLPGRYSIVRFPK